MCHSVVVSVVCVIPVVVSVVCVIPVVVIGVRVWCWVKRRGRKKTHRITSQSADKKVSYHI